MKLTNKMNLPDAIVRAVANDDYDKGDADYSITQLLKPPRIVALEREHQDEIEEDVSDRIWSLMGQVVHGILERAESVAMTEKRLYIDVDGIKVSGKMDRFCIVSGKLQDYKVITAWKFFGIDVPVEFEQQLNLYAELLRQNKLHVNTLEVVAILRDWSKLEAMRDPFYPQSQVIVRHATMWSQDKTMAFLKGRIFLHEDAKKSLPKCSREERWAKPDVYAVMKEGRKSAVRLHDSEALAEQHVESDPMNLYIQYRPGKNVRCEAYCSCAPFCTQFKQLKEEKCRLQETPA